jgi:hypothetical protein
MRRLGVLLLVLGSAAVDAHPVSGRELRDPFTNQPSSPCEASKAWSKVTACHTRQGTTVSVLYELEGAKLVSLRYPSREDATLHLYLLDNGIWHRQSFYAATNANSELLSFKPTDRAGYRLDVGMTNPTSVMIDEVSPTKALLKRILTTECRRGVGCRTLVTSCDVLVDGRAYWSFRGTVVWSEGNAVKIAGDTRFSGKLCTPARTVLAPAPIGDPLE